MTTKTDAPVEVLGLVQPEAEIAVLGAMRQSTDAAIQIADLLEADDFHDPRRGVVFQAICAILAGIEPIDTPAIVGECQRIQRETNVKGVFDSGYVESLEVQDHRRAMMYANTVKRLAWLRRAGNFAFWLVQELQTRPQPNELYAEAQERWQHLQPVRADSGFVYGWDTEPIHERLIKQRVQDALDGTTPLFDWPWASWNHNGRIRPLRPGFVGVLAAPDGMGKTTYLEQVAEHWAHRGWHVVYVHLEDDLEYKLDRRKARHSFVDMSKIEDGTMTDEERERLQESCSRIEMFAGCLHYYHAPGKSMTEIIRELETRVSEGVCQAVVFDYLDKVQPTRGQAKVYGDNTWERQANDMEAIKSFAETNKVPVFTATQGNKTMQGAGTQTRSAIQGSGQKSQKSQLVIILTRDIVGENGLKDKNGNEIAKAGQYSPIVNVRIDKQNRGETGSFKQFLVGRCFVVRDIAIQDN
jgi:replicative DNA helicase